MTFLLILLLAVAAPFCSGSHFRCRRCPITRSIRNVHWKQIAAGGAAVGTVVAAYKISNGAEEGLKTAAKEAPTAFSGMVLLLLMIPLAGGVWYFLKTLTGKG